MNRFLTGKSWCFGDFVTTDDILPGRFLELGNHEVGAHAMAGIAPGFSSRIAPGDFIVAGDNFGMGSGRENAPYAILQAGIAAVVAQSFSRLFFRTCINIGLPPVLVASTREILEGDVLEVDLEARRVHHVRTGAHLPILNLTGISLAVIESGGLLPYTRRRMGLE